jgi:preprotein translocase subunit Sec63
VTRALLLLALLALVLRAARRVYPPLRARRAPGQDSIWDPHAVLGVPKDASRELITRSYHEQLKRYHPDRVAHLGEELQQVAHRKTVELRRAYDELTR